MSGRGIVRKEDGIHQTRNTTCDQQIKCRKPAIKSTLPFFTPLHLSHFLILQEIVLVTLSSH